MSEIEVHTCGKCGIMFGAPAKWWEARREDKEAFYCPNGHPRVFRESEADKLRRERDNLQQQLARKDDTIKRQRELREAAERREAAQKANVTKLKKRAGAAMCPCCNRTFTSLRRHLAAKHPDFICEAA